MEQATNTFNKGLQLDTHPMVQGNDTLTDCLNGTLITMNGNEVILQNDMGNRRVNNAFLPPGYEPVGMKEYGGIIYIAAYNPITNKSQIGSFPSPQKKVDSLDEPDLKGEFDFGSFLSADNIETDSDLGISVLKTDSFMIPLTNDTSLRAGDKFAIYAPLLSLMEEELTNYNNTYYWKEVEKTEYDEISDNEYKKTENGKYYIKEHLNKAYSPKNRKYTLQIGILNSQNEFVDITKTLSRWEYLNDKWTPKVYNEEKSEIFKFNDGYFISDNFDENELNRSTIDDTKLIKKRQKIATNTYAYKLVGPMYLKANLNHIENFNYNIYGTYDDDKATLWIEGYLNYNCPDNAKDTDKENNSDENYDSFEEGIPGFRGFDLISVNVNDENEVEVEEPDSNDPNNIVINRSVYNPNNNLYSTKITKKYKIKSQGIYNYVLGVLATDDSVVLPDSDPTYIYLRGLSVKGQLDLSLLGSGKLSITEWRFYNDQKSESTKLTFSFNAYPEPGKSFDNLKFNFKDINDTTDETGVNYPKNGGLPLYNGRQTYNIYWKEIGLKPRKVYKVSITYNDNQVLEESIDRWLITTELFNDFYFASAGVPDFCDPDKTLKQEAKDTFKSKMIINLSEEKIISNDSIKKDDEYTGSMTSTDVNINYSCTHQIDLDITSNPNLKIANEELYPDYVFIKEEGKDIFEIGKVVVQKIGDTPIDDNDQNQNNEKFDEEFKKYLKIQEGPQTSNNVRNSFKDIEALNINISHDPNTNKVSGNITYYDIYKGYSENGISNVTNVFDTVENLISSDGAGPSEGSYGCIQVKYHEHTGGDDEHFVDLYIKEESGPPYIGTYTAGLCFIQPPDDNEIYDQGTKGFRIFQDTKDETVTAYFTNLAPKIYSYFNQGKKDGQMFMFMFPSSQIYYSKISTLDRNVVMNGGFYARVWWRTSEGEWALFSDMIPWNITFTDWIKNKFSSKKYVYCMYDSYPKEIEKIHATEDNYIYYEYHDPINLQIAINYKLKNDQLELDDILNLGNSFGNLKFSTNKTLNINSAIIDFKLESSSLFYDNIRNFDISNISNVDLSTGLTVDSEKRKLDSNYIYYMVGGDGNKKLIRLDDSPIAIDREHKIDSDNKNTITYNRSTKGVPEYRYDNNVGTNQDADSHTLVDYYLANIVQNV